MATTKKISNSWRYKILGILVFGLLIYLLIDTLTFTGARSFYCLTDNRCITVWKRLDGHLYIIYGEYSKREIPKDNFVKVKDAYLIAVLLSKENNILIELEKKVEILDWYSSNNIIELYNNNKILNDSLYTYFDSRYKRYKDNVEYLIINIKENYATDKTGEKIE